MTDLLLLLLSLAGAATLGYVAGPTYSRVRAWRSGYDTGYQRGGTDAQKAIGIWDNLRPEDILHAWAYLNDQPIDGLVGGPVGDGHDGGYYQEGYSDGYARGCIDMQMMLDAWEDGLGGLIQTSCRCCQKPLLVPEEDALDLCLVCLRGKGGDTNDPCAAHVGTRRGV